MNQYQSLLDNGTGCHTFVPPNAQSNIRYPLCTLSSDSDMDKDRHIIVYDDCPWSEFTDIYINKLREYLPHRYQRDWQNHCRDQIATPDFNGNVHLKEHTLFSSMDFIHSVRLKPKILTSATQTSHFEVQLLAIYDLQNINGNLQKRGHFYLSDNPHHN